MKVVSTSTTIFAAILAILLAPSSSLARNVATPEDELHWLLVKASALNRLGLFENAEAVLAETGLLSDDAAPSGPAAVLAETNLCRARLGRKSGAASCRVDDPVPDALRALVAFEKGRAAIAWRRPGDRDALSVMAEFISEYPGSDDEAEARLLYAGALLDDGDQKAAAQQAAGVLATDTGRSRKAAARLLLAMSLPEPESSMRLRRLFIEMPESAAAEATGLDERDLTDAELRERADAFFKTWDFVRYQAALESLRARGDKSPRLEWELAVSHLVYVRDRPAEGLALMLSARSQGVGNDPEGTFLLGRAYAKLEDYANAEKCFSDYLKTGARKKKVLARYYLAWLPYDHGEYERALPAMDRFLKIHRKSDRYSYVLWFKGWSLFRLGRYREAIVVFTSMKRLGNNLVAGKAMYWGGVAWHRLGNRRQSMEWLREAVKRYPLSWYSVLAAKRLNEWYGEKLPSWMTAPAALPADPAPLWYSSAMPADIVAAMKDVRSLAALGEPREALRVYRKVASMAEKRLRGVELARFLVTVGDATEQYKAGMKKAHRLFGKRMGRTPAKDTGVFWALRYPRAFSPLVRAAAGKFGIPELWVYSIMRQESRYDASQVSHTAALGVMQMIAATAHIVGEQVGVRWEPDSFFEPGVNILFGTRYLSDLFHDFKGQIVFASAAYNSGAPAIRRFMLANRGLPLDEMVEMIPYNEGRNYCRKVAEHLVRYGAIYLEPEERRRLYDLIFPETVDYDLGTAIDY